jgi:hypothetical protein
MQIQGAYRTHQLYAGGRSVPKHGINAEFEHFVDKYDKVMTENFTKRFIDHRYIRLAPQAPSPSVSGIIELAGIFLTWYLKLKDLYQSIRDKELGESFALPTGGLTPALRLNSVVKERRCSLLHSWNIVASGEIDVCDGAHCAFVTKKVWGNPLWMSSRCPAE